jgi:TorA maturation chaperone TorD
MQLRLLEEHILLWVPSFTKEVLEAAGTEFYTSAATITSEYLLMDTEFVRETSGGAD